MIAKLLSWGVKLRERPHRILTCKGCDRKSTDDDPIFDGTRFVVLLLGYETSYTPLAVIWGYYSKKLKGFKGMEQPSGDLCTYCDKAHRRGWGHVTRDDMLERLKDNTFKFQTFGPCVDGVIEALIDKMPMPGGGFTLSGKPFAPKRQILSEVEEYAKI